MPRNIHDMYERGKREKAGHTCGRVDRPFAASYVVGMKMRIKQIRKARGMTQEALADEAGVTQATISRLERNVANGSLTGLERIAQVLCVEVVDLFEPTDMSATVAETADAIMSLSEENRALVMGLVSQLQR